MSDSKGGHGDGRRSMASVIRTSRVGDRQVGDAGVGVVVPVRDAHRSSAAIESGTTKASFTSVPRLWSMYTTAVSSSTGREPDAEEDVVAVAAGRGSSRRSGRPRRRRARRARPGGDGRGRRRSRSSRRRSTSSVPRAANTAEQRGRLRAVDVDEACAAARRAVQAPLAVTRGRTGRLGEGRWRPGASWPGPGSASGWSSASARRTSPRRSGSGSSHTKSSSRDAGAVAVRDGCPSAWCARPCGADPSSPLAGA